MSVLNVRDLRKVYLGKRPFLAVDGISFTLKEGEVLGLLGPNGAGKTTTIQMLMSTLKPTSGSIQYFGKELQTHRSEILQHVTFASTYVSLPWNLTIEQNLNVYARLFSKSGPELIKKRDALLDRFGLLSKKKSLVSQLSSGQITRLMLVKAFMIEPKIVLLDEPTAALDPDIAHEVIQFILNEREKRGLSILFTSHNMAEVTEACDRVLFLRKGKIFADDMPQNLAKKAGRSCVELVIPYNIEKAKEIIQHGNVKVESDHRMIWLEVEENEIAPFLAKLAKERIFYSHIEITKPTLEDFFLQVSRSSEEETP